MGRRLVPAEVLWQQGVEAFAFLIKEWDFDGPERIETGLAYHRPDLHISIEAWAAWKRKSGFDTRVRWVDRAGGGCQAAGLDRLYVECSLGPAQDVSGDLGGRHVIINRIGQHAQALQLVMPHLAGPGAADLFHRCR